MKLGKSKLALAKVINENGGWPQDSEWAVQNGDHGRISFSINKPVRHDSKSWMAKGGFNFKIEVCNPLLNWHLNVLSREEYHHAYPKVDADGWIEHDGKHEPAVATSGLTLWCRWSDGLEQSHEANMVDWIDDSDVRIIAYRLHKPEIATSAREPKPVPVPEAKPTIEQLAQDYRNKLDFANRKQDEADKANMESDAALSQLEDAIAAIGFVITPLAATEKEPELVITDWLDLRVGDEVECVESNIQREKYNGMVGRLHFIDEIDTSTPHLVDFGGEARIWCHEVKFIRRP